MTITVYSKPSCVQCTATYRKMDAEGVLYDVQDAHAEENAPLIAELRHMRAPVVVVRDDDGKITDHWSGFVPGKITELASELKAA